MSDLVPVEPRPDQLDEETLVRIAIWLKDRPAEHAVAESAAMVREFGISNNMARMIRALAGRDQFTDCGCCEGIGDHACGGECHCCGGTGRNPGKVACELPHGGDCGCSWGEES